MHSAPKATPSRRARAWFVIGHYGGSNTGDEAMLAGLVDAGSALFGAGSSVLVKGGALPPFLEGRFTAVPPGLRTVLAALRRSEGLILGGGTHFHDDYTLPRYSRHLLYLARLVAVSALARAGGRPVLWLGMGFGPFHRAPTRWLTRLGLRTCDFVTVRDTASRQEVAHWLPASRLERVFDLAALLGQPGAASHAPQLGPVLGLSVTSAGKSRETGDKADRRFWTDFGRALGRLFSERPELRIEIFVFRGGSREDDHRLSGDLLQTLLAIDPERVALRPYQADPRQTLRALTACSAFVATRYHSVLLAYLAGCSLCCVRYHQKVAEIAREIGLDETARIDPRRAGEPLLYERLGALLDRDPAFRPKLPREEAGALAQRNLEILGRFNAS